jgi:cytochrome c oxidase subunit 2
MPGMGYQASRLALRVWLTATISAIALASTLSVASADWFQPKTITEQAEQMRSLYILVTVMAIVVWVLVTGALVYILVRFKKRDDELPPQIHGSNVLEVIWTGIPIIIVLILFVVSFVVLIDIQEDAEPEDLTVDVLAFQFGWQFTYDLQDLGPSATPSEGTVVVFGTHNADDPSDVAGLPVLVIPVNEPVEFKLNAADVIHSFYFRNGLYKLDLVPGRENSFTITANETGTYDGQCAELCGLNHALMRFRLQVVERAEFDAWVAEQAESETEPAAQQPR